MTPAKNYENRLRFVKDMSSSPA